MKIDDFERNQENLARRKQQLILISRRTNFDFPTFSTASAKNSRWRLQDEQVLNDRRGVRIPDALKQKMEELSGVTASAMRLKGSLRDIQSNYANLVQGRLLPPLPTMNCLNVVFEASFLDLPFVVYRAPKVVSVAADLHEDLIQVPAPLVDPAHSFGPPLADLVCEVCPEAIDRETDAFVTNIHAALVRKVFDVAKRQKKSDEHSYAKLDDLRRSFEVAEWVFTHSLRLKSLPSRLKI